VPGVHNFRHCTVSSCATPPSSWRKPTRCPDYHASDSRPPHRYEPRRPYRKLPRADIEPSYGLAAQWDPDAILIGSETVLAAVRDNPALEVYPEHEELAISLESAPDPRPLLVVADSRGRVRCRDPSGRGRTYGTYLPCARLRQHRSISITRKSGGLARSLAALTASTCVLRWKR
jgi:hypothetical protein